MVTCTAGPGCNNPAVEQASPPCTHPEDCAAQAQELRRQQTDATGTVDQQQATIDAVLQDLDGPPDDDQRATVETARAAITEAMQTGAAAAAAAAQLEDPDHTHPIYACADHLSLLGGQ